MDEELKGLLVGRIQDVCKQLARNGGFLIEDAASQVIAGLNADSAHQWKKLRDHFASRGVLRYVNKVIEQAQAVDPAQQMLPGLESMPLLVTAEGAAILSQQLDYDKYHDEVMRLERKINSYRYKRRKPENLEQDVRRLEEMKRFDPRFAQYSKQDPEITLAKAKAKEAEESPDTSPQPNKPRGRNKRPKR